MDEVRLVGSVAGTRGLVARYALHDTGEADVSVVLCPGSGHGRRSTRWVVTARHAGILETADVSAEREVRL